MHNSEETSDSLPKFDDTNSGKFQDKCNKRNVVAFLYFSIYRIYRCCFQVAHIYDKYLIIITTR